MCEPIGGTDDERVEGVAAVEAGSAGNGWIGGVGTFSEVVGPTLLSADGLTIFVTLVGVTRRFQVGFVSEGIRLWERGVVDVVGGRSDAHSELDLLPESTAERVSDWCSQMTLDLILDKAARNRQQSKPLDDRERLDEVEPGPLLRRQGSDESCAIGERAVRGGFTVKFGDDRVPYCCET